MINFNATFFELYKEFYQNGTYTKDNLKFFVQLGTLSTDGYAEIVGESYDAPSQTMGE